jgi:hypothetical protein
MRRVNQENQWHGAAAVRGKSLLSTARRFSIGGIPATGAGSPAFFGSPPCMYAFSIWTAA